MIVVARSRHLISAHIELWGWDRDRPALGSRPAYAAGGHPWLASGIHLELEPRPAGCRKLTGESQYRVRVGDYRIVYEVRDRELPFLVLRVAHRRDVYRR
jgi:hypothetical protein